MILDTANITIDKLSDELFLQKQITLSVLRLDKIDPIISGNKLFKLHYYLEEVRLQNKNTIITFGGAYSNHLAATAYACKLLNLNCIGNVRGEKPAILSHTLQHCLQNKMQLQFISREEYDKKEDTSFLQELQQNNSNALIIPEGGYSKHGCMGASLIADITNFNNYTHIAIAIGTATTISGILQKTTSKIIGIPVLKGITDVEQRIFHLTQKNYSDRLTIWHNFHFGGYAKKSSNLIDFINNIWIQHLLPLDFVYTGKAFYGVLEKIKADYFPTHSNILFIHTGGLQGNLSLPQKTLTF